MYVCVCMHAHMASSCTAVKVITRYLHGSQPACLFVQISLKDGGGAGKSSELCLVLPYSNTNLF